MATRVGVCHCSRKARQTEVKATIGPTLTSISPAMMIRVTAQAAIAIDAPSRRIDSWLLADRKPVRGGAEARVKQRQDDEQPDFVHLERAEPETAAVTGSGCRSTPSRVPPVLDSCRAESEADGAREALTGRETPKTAPVGAIVVVDAVAHRFEAEEVVSHSRVECRVRHEQRGSGRTADRRRWPGPVRARATDRGLSVPCLELGVDPAARQPGAPPLKSRSPPVGCRTVGSHCVVLVPEGRRLAPSAPCCGVRGK